jgi:hypothetical protein
MEIPAVLFSASLNNTRDANLTDRSKIDDRLAPPTLVFSSPEGLDDRF